MSAPRLAEIEPSTIGRGALVFAAGMVLAAASFVVEQMVIKTIKARD